MSPRRRQWLAALATVLLVLAVTVAWTSYLRARSTPLHVQVEPGAMAAPAQESAMAIRLTSLTVTPGLLTDGDTNYAPAGAVWVIAVLDYVPPPEGGTCRLDLLAIDGRSWSPSDSLDYEGSRTLPGYCSATPGEGTPRAELIYLIPQDAAGQLAGLVSSATAYRGTEPFWVLTPPN